MTKWLLSTSWYFRNSKLQQKAPNCAVYHKILPLKVVCFNFLVAEHLKKKMNDKCDWKNWWTHRQMTCEDRARPLQRAMKWRFLTNSPQSCSSPVLEDFPGSSACRVLSLSSGRVVQQVRSILNTCSFTLTEVQMFSNLLIWPCSILLCFLVVRGNLCGYENFFWLEKKLSG